MSVSLDLDPPGGAPRSASVGSAHCGIVIGYAGQTVVLTVHGELDTAESDYLGGSWPT